MVARVRPILLYGDPILIALTYVHKIDVNMLCCVSSSLLNILKICKLHKTPYVMLQQFDDDSSKFKV